MKFLHGQQKSLQSRGLLGGRLKRPSRFFSHIYFRWIYLWKASWLFTGCTAQFSKCHYSIIKIFSLAIWWKAHQWQCANPCVIQHNGNIMRELSKLGNTTSNLSKQQGSLSFQTECISCIIKNYYWETCKKIYCRVASLYTLLQKKCTLIYPSSPGDTGSLTLTKGNVDKDDPRSGSVT